MQPNGQIIVGIDVGGTFTDLTLYDPQSGETRAVKSPSDSARPDQGVLAALDKSGLDLGDCGLMVHGTTVGTNALLERKGARTAMITTAGFRDVIELGRTTRMTPNTLYNPYFRKTPPLVRRKDRHTIAERIGADGAVDRPLDEAALAALAKRLSAGGTESVAVCLLNSYANDAHEQAVADHLRAHIPFVCRSVDVLNEIREYERFSTCVINAYLMPLMGRYAGRLVDTLRERGYQGSFHTMASNGGLLSDAMVRAVPVRTILSGPAAGVAAAAYLMQGLGRGDYVTYDMGGTSTDVALVVDGTWPVKRETVLEGIMIKIPQLDIQTIGAGGGSIASLDAGDSLLVGPESAGARPGPACYGHGGEEPTVTDANVVLGRLGAGQELGASLRIDADAARAAVARLAARRKITVETMAAGIVRVAVAKMAAAIYEISVARGHDPRELALLPFGGAGPLHACAIADELGIGSVVVPPVPGAFSAYGGLCSSLFKEKMATLLAPLDAAAIGRMAELAVGSAAALTEEFKREGLSTERLRFRREIDARYLGQAHEVTVEVPDDVDPGAARALFETEFERQFGRRDSDKPVEIVNLRVIGEILPEPPALRPMATRETAVAPVAMRPVYHETGFADCPVYDRETLAGGATIAGPAIVQEMSSTVYLPPDWTLAVGRFGELELTRTQT